MRSIIILVYSESTNDHIEHIAQKFIQRGRFKYI